ncbi:hypothetical protein OHS58_09920 [Amycolatopsis sp. NBC_00348]|uniref:hypothetical protein n=1 Tax=Amycolatopsis sp. NBC_00348 TaxID=2975956 RepID=UPI002E270EB4
MPAAHALALTTVSAVRAIVENLTSVAAARASSPASGRIASGQYGGSPKKRPGPSRT